MAIQIQYCFFYRPAVCFWRQHLQTIPQTFRLLHRNDSVVVSSTYGFLLTWREAICLLSSFAVESYGDTQIGMLCYFFFNSELFCKEVKILKEVLKLTLSPSCAIYAWGNSSDLELNNSSLHGSFPNCSIYQITKNDFL